MAQDPLNLIWIDMEMSGLDPETDRVLEVAIVITDSTPELNTVAEAPVLVVHQSDDVLERMDDWNRSTHGKSGLIERVKASTLTDADVEEQMVAFISEYVPQGKSPMCGNSVHQDRRFLSRYMPRLEEYFLYRNLDVSTLKELWRRWKPSLTGFAKHGKHEALADIHESIDELRYYREHFLKI
ncbi:MAG: Exonuclease RNase and polymerase [Betaproteobacteria bacterium]|nr:Exonuclease RNase and polymerase [Betaproteobacteria bacterium]